jgi:flagellar biosynthetic protein FlhB
MAEEDDSQKTEDPSGRKLDRARARGQVAKSQEIAHWGILAAGGAALIFAAPWSMSKLYWTLRPFVESPAQMAADQNSLQLLIGHIVLSLAVALWPVFLLLILAALAVHLVQNGLIWATEKFEFDLSRLSPVKGLGRLFSARNVIEFVKGVAKLMLVGGGAFALALPLLNGADLFPAMGVAAVVGMLDTVVLRVAMGALLVLTVLAGLDFFYQRYAFTKQMRMTKHEVKDEHKQTEGDPMVKGRIRKLRAERARQRMMAAVPKATVVVTNPTHYAVALKYEMNSMEAPKLVAKGVDHLALRIRTLAEENDVPIVENPPLARALYATVELEDEIPVEHYKAVAEVIGYVMKLKGKLN